jgi:inhibitor of cysteine peptidase
MATLTIDRSDQRATVVANRGDTIEIHLDENPTTGFRWVDVGNDRRLPLESSEFRPAADDRVGRGGSRVLRFKAFAPGLVRLDLQLQREWEGNPSTKDRFELTIRIAD